MAAGKLSARSSTVASSGYRSEGRAVANVVKMKSVRELSRSLVAPAWPSQLAKAYWTNFICAERGRARALPRKEAPKAFMDKAT